MSANNLVIGSVHSMHFDNFLASISLLFFIFKRVPNRFIFDSLEFSKSIDFEAVSAIFSLTQNQFMLDHKLLLNQIDDKVFIVKKNKLFFFLNKVACIYFR